MNILLDTHVVLWLIFDTQKLNNTVKDAIKNATTVYVSDISLWEVSLKHSTGKLSYTPDLVLSGIKKSEATSLALAQSHIIEYKNIKLDNKDPFDRMLVAQTVSQNLVLVTADRILLSSEYPTIDATKP